MLVLHIRPGVEDERDTDLTRGSRTCCLPDVAWCSLHRTALPACAQERAGEGGEAEASGSRNLL